VDRRTKEVIEAIDPVAASLLLRLLDGASTEIELLDGIAPHSQPTINRRLHRLEHAGLLVREDGSPHAPGRLWALAHPEETAAVLEKLLELSGAIDAIDRARREEAQKALLRARATRLGIREASDGSAG
jgi:DNA-binding HxlR family transcriptional regulator